ncbi:hypothetical protein [Paenibacillus algorifonticola]|uniref:hypothetical protein n=1 Tax=Paenibacillus algorifonticola TaxID=684063 RepID=UPI001160D3B1|nr:hypothetical protein [Paenibacillus algorifonticola]
MRIFSKAALQFDHPKDFSVKASVRPGEFKDVPDWVEDSVMFKLASKDGTVMLVDSKAQEIAAETPETKQKSVIGKRSAPDSE